MVGAAPAAPGESFLPFNDHAAGAAGIEIERGADALERGRNSATAAAPAAAQWGETFRPGFGWQRKRS